LEIEKAMESPKKQYKQIGVDYSGGKDMTVITLTGEQTETAIKALEKQIPKEPKTTTEQLSLYDFATEYFCPCCGKNIGSNIAEGEDWICQDEYCPKCGQHINWS